LRQLCGNADAALGVNDKVPLRALGRLRLSLYMAVVNQVNVFPVEVPVRALGRLRLRQEAVLIGGHGFSVEVPLRAFGRRFESG
jgi:hypothetical protein